MSLARNSAIGLISARVVIVLAAMASGASEVNAQGFDRFNSGALRCLQSGHRGVCQRALDDAEVLQQLASSRQAYPCQTLLLGVQAISSFNSWEMAAVIERFQIFRRPAAAVLAFKAFAILC